MYAKHLKLIEMCNSMQIMLVCVIYFKKYNYKNVCLEEKNIKCKTNISICICENKT